MDDDFRWQLPHARRELDALVRAALKGRPQIIADQGQDAAVVISIEDYRRLRDQHAPSLIDLLLNFPKGPETFDREPRR